MAYHIWVSIPTMDLLFSDKKHLTRILVVVISNSQQETWLSIREAMDDYSMSGGSLTKCISILKREGNDIVKVWKIHPLTGKRYARYYAREFLPVKYAA